MDCIFCEIVAGKKQAHFIYEDKTHIAILDKYPFQRGHALVMPRMHHEKIIDMGTKNVSMLFSKVPLIARGILDATQAEGFNIGQNNGRAANQIIPHVHVHIIPRYANTGTIWSKRMIGNDDDLAELASRIRKYIKTE